MAQGTEEEDDNFSIELQSQSESESEGPLDLIGDNSIKAPDLLGELMREEEALVFVPKILQTKKKNAIIKQLRSKEVKQSVATIFSSLRHHNTQSQKDYSSIDSRSQQSSNQSRIAETPLPKESLGLQLTKQKVWAVKHYFDSNPDIAYNLNYKLKNNPEYSVCAMARRFQISKNAFRDLKSQWLKNPYMPQALMKVEYKYKTRPNDHVLLITHFIREIMKKEDNLSITELKQRVRELMPNDLKDKVNTCSVRNALLFKNQNILKNSQTISTKQRQKINSLSSRTQYCKNVLALLESGRKVYFLAEERIAFGRESLVSSQKQVYFRGLLGTDNLAFWDYFDSNSDFNRSKSLRFLLHQLHLRDKESDKRIVMSKQLMRLHNQALQYAAEEGFVLVEFAETMRQYNPITFWVRDLKARARKNGMRTRDDLKLFFHYECGCFQKRQYQGYFSQAKRVMEAKIEDDRA